ncbi:hypothetical protein [Yoonia sp.]|uniref:hypothetical protein n=1 Tax=Yoonia sp. TaxID=2212373 RepID=UPI00391D4A8F
MNRNVKLARGLGLLQYNIALDSDFGEKESLTALFSGGNPATRQHMNKKDAPGWARLFAILSSLWS